MSRRNGTVNTPQIRRAIYTRKSTDEGLDQAFNSLDAQRESAEAYIASQKAEGWTCIPTRYDDGGVTGGNMKRPALQRHFADIENGKVDYVVVYKVDRLSRSTFDFARMMDTFDEHGLVGLPSFVCIELQPGLASKRSDGARWRIHTDPTDQRRWSKTVERNR